MVGGGYRTKHQMGLISDDVFGGGKRIPQTFWLFVTFKLHSQTWKHSCLTVPFIFFFPCINVKENQFGVMMKLQVVKNLKSVCPVGSSTLTSLWYNNPFKLIPNCSRAFEFTIRFTKYAKHYFEQKHPIFVFLFTVQYINFVQVTIHHKDVSI